ncbi:hypothetical protein [Lentibacillus sediminis]|uniref:hypothetical protein n=1 Tax=Lentibacillus sediminis TaxID=1940529 RepID=UPI000C1BF8A3|nr:hypothetical protein [Lentibacillus sediminis]
MKRGPNKGLVFAGALLALGAVVAVVYFFFLSSERQAVSAVESFYTYEQENQFADSWELFHPLMQERFSKPTYIQDRPHIIMSHFGVETFTYTIEEVQKVQNWQMEADAEPIEEAYRMTVYQDFKGTYGNFTIVQHVYAAEADGEWSVLWDYSGQ